MAPAPYATLLSSVLGACGTSVLFFSSFTLEPREGAHFGSLEMDERNERIEARNNKRKIWQKIGLGLLCLSFVVQAVSVVLLQ
jgi:hypothetical protein